MARADLSAMLGRLDDAPAPVAASPVEDQATTAEKPQVARKSPQRREANKEPSARIESPTSGGGYLSFERKETRLRADQYATLTQEARRLNRAKGTPGERITENTLIRVAIDLLLERTDQLRGANEDELRKSVGL